MENEMQGDVEQLTTNRNIIIKGFVGTRATA